MSSIFVNWNPRLHSWVGHPNPATAVWWTKQGLETHIQWTVRDSSRIERGDSVYFMLHDGTSQVGVLGHGQVAGPLEELESWDPNAPGKTPYVPIALQSMVTVENALPVMELAAELGYEQWLVVPSGAHIPDDIDSLLASAWDRHWRTVVNRSCPYCGDTRIELEACSLITQPAHRCSTCDFRWGGLPKDSIINSPADLPATIGRQLQDLERYLRWLHADGQLTIVRHDSEELVVQTTEAEISISYPFLGTQFFETFERDDSDDDEVELEDVPMYEPSGIGWPRV